VHREEREREHKLLNKTKKKTSGEGRRSAGSFLDWSPKIGCGETRRRYRNFV
jgi:hypothetical protein